LKNSANSFLSFFLLPFNEISTNSYASILGWRMEGGGVTYNFEIGPTKGRFSLIFQEKILM